MIDNIFIKYAMSNTKQLIVETFIKNANYMRDQCKSRRTYLKHCLDLELISQAINDKKFVQQLDLNETDIEIDKLLPIIEDEEAFTLKVLDLISLWLQGDSKRIALEENGDEDLVQRNIYWMREAELKDIEGRSYTGLVNFLENTNIPTCIAVGTYHCVGNYSPTLLKGFKNVNFTIEQMKESDIYHIARQKLFELLEDIC